jgi:hypothetical protein
VSSLYSIRSKCRLCESDDLESVLDMQPTPVPDKYLPKDRLAESRELIPLDLFMCTACGNLQTGAVTDPNVIYTHYLSRPAAVNPVLSGGYKEYAESVVRRFSIGSDDLVVEMGSNDGAFLNFFKNQGASVLGVDPAQNLAEVATKSGIETIQTFFSSEVSERIKKERGEAKAVIANFVYANIDHVIDVTEGVRNLLAPNGIFCFETNYRVDVFQKDLIETINHEHLTYYAVKPLRAFFNRLGMQLIEVQRVPSKGGAIRCVAQLEGGPHAISDTVDDLVDLEEKEGLYQSDYYKSCDSHIKSVREDMQLMFKDLDPESGSIAGYGTSIGATILIYQLGLGEALDFLVDDDPYRQGLVSPGYHMPVQAPQTLIEHNVRHVLILAPLYAEQIMKKNQAYVDQGGQFVGVWPEAKKY